MNNSIGVDIIEFSKAKRFYKTHRSCLENFLTASEKRFVESGAKPHEALAMVLSAKEAVFKTMNKPWMGSNGFREIKVTPSPDGEFIYKRAKLKIKFKKNRHHVVAYCASDVIPASSRNPAGPFSGGQARMTPQ